MSKDKNDEVKRCMLCHKKLISDKGLVCRRCLLQGKDIGGKVLGTGAAVASVALVVLKAIGDMNNTTSDD